MKKYSWLGYPAIIVVLILLTWAGLMSGSAPVLTSLKERNQKISDQRQLINKLEAKSAQLSQTNSAQAKQQLADLLLVAPSSKQIDIVMAVVNQSAQAAGVSVTGYTANVGGVTNIDNPFTIMAQMEVLDLTSLQQVLASLEKKLPLVRIDAVTYSPPQASIGLVPLWGPLPELQREVAEPLPDTSEYASLRTKLANFTRVVVESTGTASGSAAPGPDDDPFSL